MLKFMKSSTLAAALLVALLAALPHPAPSQTGPWRAASTTATGITGDLAFGGEKISINFNSYAIADIRTLTPAELNAVFNPEATAPATGIGRLYRLSIPGDKRFLHKNTLCGGEETQWLVTFVKGKDLQVAFFSGIQMPALTAESIANTTALCGTYSYVR